MSTNKQDSGADAPGMFLKTRDKAAMKSGVIHSPSTICTPPHMQAAAFQAGHKGNYHPA